MKITAHDALPGRAEGPFEGRCLTCNRPVAEHLRVRGIDPPAIASCNRHLRDYRRILGCPDCRRAELDAQLAELERQGLARVIRVRDLEAAMEARVLGREAADAIRFYPHCYVLDRPVAYERDIRAAAHLARQALGLAEGE